MPSQLNVFGEPIEACSSRPVTGFYRNGCCDTGPDDPGVHKSTLERTDPTYSAPYRH